jgi:alkylation response protein AidB-like acyl-CoA dehydrogenase
MIVHEEFTNAFFPADVYEKGYIGGMVIGTPPIMNFASPQLKSRILPSIYTGEKRIVLAISEPHAGSDVAQIQTRAIKTSDGKFYIVNGVKKWITGGPYANYFCTAVRTGSGNTAQDISMLLIERDQGVETRKISTSDGFNTAYVVFENVKVPVGNLLGSEGMGFQVIMYNFNHERWIMICGCVAMSRLVLQECFKWANQRIVFGKALIQQPVIRNKLAHMVTEVEAMHSWLESITFQMTKMSYREQAKKLAGPIALGKLKCTRVAHFISDEACQVVV